MEWKFEWMKEICELCDEYRQLDGLEDAKRASEIPDEILAIAEKEKIKTVERMYWDLFVEETGDENGEVDNNYYPIWLKEKLDNMK